MLCRQLLRFAGHPRSRVSDEAFRPFVRQALIPRTWSIRVPVKRVDIYSLVLDFRSKIRRGKRGRRNHASKSNILLISLADEEGVLSLQAR